MAAGSQAKTGNSARIGRLLPLALALACAGRPLWPQTPDPLLVWLDRIAQRQLDRREEAVAAIRTRADADRYRETVRATMLELLGGLPGYRGPLKARVTGVLRAPTHAIEKVIFESLPGLYVTANLYRPHQPGRYPGVVVPSGHTQEGKPEPQILAANLAAKGFVALTFDPIGQGEREQHYLPQLGRTLSGGGGNEHLELGARSILIGQSVARYFIHDARRSIDYLASRPDVDPERIGVTGCSGGGAITAYAAAFDPRVKAAAPGCFINSFRTLFTGPTADSEMSFPRFLAAGLDIGDFFLLPAPLPWLMMATAGDYFPPEGTRKVYEETRRIYALYGAADRVRLHIGPGPHGTPRESREEIYRWMIRWLAGGAGGAEEKPVRIFTSLELQVTAGGNVDGEPGSRKVYQVIADEFHARRQPRGSGELLHQLRRLGVPSSGRAPAVTVKPGEGGGALRIEDLRFETEPGVPVSGRLYLPSGGGRKPAVIVLEEKRLPVPLYVQRSQSTQTLAEAMAKAGRVVLEFSPRDSPDALDGRPFLGNWVTNERADLVGRNLPALRAHDVLVAVDSLAARADVDPRSIRGYARGVKGFWLLLAAAADPRLKKIWLDRTPWSFAQGLESPLTSHLFEALIPGFALHWDMRDLVAAAGPHRVLWTDPTNWMNRVVPLGPPFRYRAVAEGDGPSIEEFF